MTDTINTTTASKNNKAVKPKETRQRYGQPQATRSPYIRNLIIEKSNNHLNTPSEIAKVLNIPRTTVAGIIKRHEERGSAEYQRLGGDLRSLLKDHHKQFIIETIDDNNIITLLELKKK